MQFAIVSVDRLAQDFSAGESTNAVFVLRDEENVVAG
jgi:hypothetical protein